MLSQHGTQRLHERLGRTQDDEGMIGLMWAQGRPADDADHRRFQVDRRGACEYRICVRRGQAFMLIAGPNGVIVTIIKGRS